MLYQWQKDAALKWVRDQIHLAKLSERRVAVALLTQQAIKRQGVTFEPDVKRLARELCSRLAELHAAQKEAEKEYAEGVERISERIAQ